MEIQESQVPSPPVCVSRCLTASGLLMIGANYLIYLLYFIIGYVHIITYEIKIMELLYSNLGSINTNGTRN